MRAAWVATHHPCTHCGHPADRAAVGSILHTYDDGTTAGLYCTAPACAEAETAAWTAATRP